MNKGREANAHGSCGPDRREEPAVVGARRAGEPPRRRRRRARGRGRRHAVGRVEEPALRPVAARERRRRRRRARDRGFRGRVPIQAPFPILAEVEQRRDGNRAVRAERRDGGLRFRLS